MAHIELTPEQIEHRKQIREARLSRSVSDVAKDIRREQEESYRDYVEAVRRGEA